MTVLLLLASFVLIVVGAILFTNAVEWAGQNLNLGHGAGHPIGPTLPRVRGVAQPGSAHRSGR